jgi:hypothetical protein
MLTLSRTREVRKLLSLGEDDVLKLLDLECYRWNIHYLGF